MAKKEYEVTYHPLVADDIARIDARRRKHVHAAIETKLTTRPDLFGSPLRQSLRGYRKLRVGDYRIVYRIEKQTVRIIVIVHRSSVYKRAERRT